MNDINKDIDNLFLEIKNTCYFKNYIECKRMLENNKEIISLIEKIKNYQKTYVNSKDSKIKNEIDILYDELNNYPLYVSYVNYKDELNENLFMIKDQFEKYFYNILKLDI